MPQIKKLSWCELVFTFPICMYIATYTCVHTDTPAYTHPENNVVNICLLHINLSLLYSELLHTPPVFVVIPVVH